MKSRVFLLVNILLAGVFMLGCSSGNGTMPTAPEGVSPQAGDKAASSHYCWGVWQFTCDPVAGTVEIAKMREADLHLNAVHFLEPPAKLYLTLESPPQFTGNVVDVDIGLRHPFLGLVQYTGFDACGILISHGSISGFASDPDISMPGPGKTRLLNADGFTRWWNPTEFPPNESTPIQGYKDGLLGTEDAIADFDATLNGYKYFADDLEPNAPVSSVDATSRGYFLAGNKNVRHYKIDMGDSFVFNYAVDANWAYPVGPPPISVPDDFPAKANRPEAWNISVHELDNTLAWEEGEAQGHLLATVDVYDWFDAGLNEVTVESLAGIAPVSATVPIGGGEGYSTYEVDLSGESLTESGEIDLLVTVRSEKAGYQGLLPGKYISAYFISTTHVKDKVIKYNWVFDDEQTLTTTVDMDRSPSIIQGSAYQIDIGYTRLQLLPTGSTLATCQMLASDDNGLSFVYMWCANSYHGGQVLMDLKSSLDTFGNAAFMYQSWIYPSMELCLHASLVRDPNFFIGDNQGIYLPNTEHADEVIWAADDMVVCLGDRQGEIMYKKGNYPYSCMYNHDWVGWFTAPEIVIVDSPARLGETRCICKDAAGAIHFAFFGGEDGPWIKMLTNSDGLGENWDTGVYITEGLTDEYSSRVEPSLVIGPDGEFHATFVGIIDPKHSILYASSGDGVDWPGYKPIYSNLEGYLGQATVDAFKYEKATVVVISFEMDGDIWFINSIDGGLTFSEPVMISDGTGNSLEPDIRADAQGYVHFAWSEFVEKLAQVDNYDIHYRRAYLVPG